MLVVLCVWMRRRYILFQRVHRRLKLIEALLPSKHGIWNCSNLVSRWGRERAEDPVEGFIGQAQKWCKSFPPRFHWPELSLMPPPTSKGGRGLRNDIPVIIWFHGQGAWTCFLKRIFTYLAALSLSCGTLRIFTASCGIFHCGSQA